MVVFTLWTWETYNGYMYVWKLSETIQYAHVTHIVFPLHASPQSWTAQSQATSRTASGRYCRAGCTVTASRLLSRIAATLATTCWAPAPSPVKGMVPGIAPCPNACVSTSGTGWNWCSFITQIHHLDYIHSFFFSFCNPTGQWCCVIAPAYPPMPRSQGTAGRSARLSATAASASAPSSATQPECASWTASGAARHHTALVRKTQFDCV